MICLVSARRLAAALLLSALACLLLPAAPAAAQDNVYEVETLNEGLGEVPGYIDRATPRSSIESLITAARYGRLDAAAHLLDLSDYPAAEQAEVGEDLARKLEVVIDRKAVIDWDTLLDRPDALDARASDRSATAGMTRRSILLWSLELDGHPAALRLNRVQPDGGEPVWVFSRQTVQNIEQLYLRYGPSWLERQLPQMFHDKVLGGLMLWELLGLPVLVALAVLAGFLVRQLLNQAARWVESRLLTDIYRAIRGPAIFGTVVAIMAIGTTSIFVFSGRIDTILKPLITLGIAGSLLWLVVNAVDAVLDRLIDFQTDNLTKRQQAEQRSMATKVAAGRRALIVVFVATAIGFALSSTTIYQNLGLSLIGTAGALTLILGFAARRVLGNIMSSLQIALNQSARIGDRIVYREQLCHVERINFTYVQLRHWEGARIVVPVEEFVSEPFENWTLQEPEMLRTIKLRVAHTADVDLLRRLFDQVIEALPQDELADIDDAFVAVALQDMFGLEVWFCLPCADPNTSWMVACEARERLMTLAAEAEEDSGRKIFAEPPAAEGG
jgi:small-conductance mechanosensitive channel